MNWLIRLLGGTTKLHHASKMREMDNVIVELNAIISLLKCKLGDRQFREMKLKTLPARPKRPVPKPVTVRV